MRTEPDIAARIVVRQPCAQDSESVSRLLVGLSLASRYHRFFSAIPHVTPKLVAAMVTVTPSQLVLLALDGDTVVGHVMAVSTGEDVVDIGIVVAERYQYQGVGRRLVHELADALAVCGLNRVRCDVLSENYFVRDWLLRLLPDIRFERNGDTLTVHGTLTAHAN